jgi:hypothetical protein
MLSLALMLVSGKITNIKFTLNMILLDRSIKNLIGMLLIHVFKSLDDLLFFAGNNV